MNTSAESRGSHWTFAIAGRLEDEANVRSVSGFGLEKMFFACITMIDETLVLRSRSPRSITKARRPPSCENTAGRTTPVLHVWSPAIVVMRIMSGTVTGRRDGACAPSEAASAVIPMTAQFTASSRLPSA
jgi:hypothetical protein